jgi:ATP phosphoribosyltransferase
MVERLVIALPKGALYETSANLLRDAGIDVPADPGRRLSLPSADGKTELLLLRAVDVPAYVEFGAADCGIVGKDVLWETERQVCEIADLRFGFCRLVVAARRVDRYHQGAPFPTFLRAATKFVRTTESWFGERDLPVQVIPLHGSVELSPLVGLADLIVDLVATGNTLREHDLVEVAEIDRSTARLVVNPVRFRAKYELLRDLQRRLLERVEAL